MRWLGAFGDEHHVSTAATELVWPPCSCIYLIYRKGTKGTYQ